MNHTLSQTLHQKGYRLTSQRQQILGVITKFPQSVAEITSALASKGIIIDTVTVYRTLDCFNKLGIISKAHIGTAAKYEIFSQTIHHHHLICNMCGTIADIPLKDNYLIKSVAQQTNFLIKNHSLEFFGLCQRCQA